MSRPHGLPARPPNGGYEPDNYRPSHSSNDDDYHYGRRREENRDSYSRNSDVYQFRGNQYSRDENRAPMNRSSDFSYRHDDGNSKFEFDSYRPTPPQAEFTFRREEPPSIDSYRNHIDDSYRPNQSGYNNNRNASRNDGRGFDSYRGAGNRGRGGYQGRGGLSKKAADRPFLRGTRARTPDLMAGMEEEDASGAKYRALEDMSDSDEAEMDVSDESDDDRTPADVADADKPRIKQVRTSLKQAADEDSVPRWSNPDPYTALPPPDESQRKKKDVVKLIRKARVSNTADAAEKSVAAQDDFISFDFGDAEEDDISLSDDPALAGAPTGPRGYSHRSEMYGESTMPSIPAIPVVDSKPPVLGKHTVFDASAIPSNRKRTYDDSVKRPPLTRKIAPSRPARGHILPEWESKSNSNSTPWCTVGNNVAEKMGYHRLHDEIMDFYHHVKPTDFEETMRHNLVSKLRAAIQRKWPDALIDTFGSFPAGLYLPTADMDLVFRSRQFVKDEYYPVYNKKKHLFNLKSFLISERIAAQDTVETIIGAKVPIVKYVDAHTGLRVDISFENNTGVIANDTFQSWRRQFPAMPILVTLIKQFLAMRGLNEPVNGGIGGFTVTCLVTSLLQLMPEVQSGKLIPEHHLGEMLMAFFDMYGYQFNHMTNAIRMDPPGYVSKVHARDVYYKQYDRLSVIDPNRPSNDICGGASNTQVIIDSFKNAYYDLRDRMDELSDRPISETQGQSILGAIIGGDYSSFEVQRQYLQDLHDRAFPWE